MMKNLSYRYFFYNILRNKEEVKNIIAQENEKRKEKEKNKIEKDEAENWSLLAKGYLSNKNGKI